MRYFLQRRGEGIAALGDLIHRIPAGHAERSPFPLRGEGKGYTQKAFPLRGSLIPTSIQVRIILLNDKEKHHADH